jgi:hypothetical protein
MENKETATNTPSLVVQQQKQPLLTPTVATSLVILGAGGVLAWKLYDMFKPSDSRFGQGSVSAQNEKGLQTELQRLSTEVNKDNIPKDNIYYRNVADSLYQVLNNEMFSIDFGVFTKYTKFPKVVDLVQKLNADEQKEVVIAFGTKPRSFLFEFGAANGLFDWFERLFTIEQIEMLASIFAKSKLWRTPTYPVIGLFKSERNIENAKLWSPWQRVRQGQDAYPIGGKDYRYKLYQVPTDINQKDLKWKVVDEYRTRGYLSPDMKVNALSPRGAIQPSMGSVFLVGTIADPNAVGVLSGKNLFGKTFGIDARYYKPTLPTNEWIKKHKITQ